MAKKQPSLAELFRSEYGTREPKYSVKKAVPNTPVKGKRNFSVRVSDTGKPATAVEREVENVFGMQPGLQRPGLIPFRRNPVTRNIEAVAPQALYDAARAFVSPSVALQGKPMDMQDEALNFAVNFTGAGAPRALAARPLEGGAVELGMSGGRRSKVSSYSDPETNVISDWEWRPLTEVKEQLGGLSAVPSHVIDFGRFMDAQASKAASGKMTARDLIKAFTTTRASIQRRATDADLLRAASLQLPEGLTGPVRPEGAFAEWLGTPEGQAYLDAAQRGNVHDRAIESAVAGMSPFGKQNDLRDALTWAAVNLPGREGQAADLVAAGKEMASDPSDWRVFTKDIRGVGPSKSGFLASLLGRGDQPTLDARQIILNTGRPTKEASRYLARKGGQGGVEGVERLAARQQALDLDLPEELRPYYQHLAHHAIWDKAGDEVTTHSDIINALQNYRHGGLAVKR